MSLAENVSDVVLYTTRDEFETQQSQVILDLCVEENLVEEIT